MSDKYEKLDDESHPVDNKSDKVLTINETRGNSFKPPTVKGQDLIEGHFQSHDIKCPLCRTQVYTFVERRKNTFQIVMAVVFLLFTCVLVCVPFCIDSWYTFVHTCPNCNYEIG